MFPSLFLNNGLIIARLIQMDLSVTKIYRECVTGFQKKTGNFRKRRNLSDL